METEYEGPLYPQLSKRIWLFKKCHHQRICGFKCYHLVKNHYNNCHYQMLRFWTKPAECHQIHHQTSNLHSGYLHEITAKTMLVQSHAIPPGKTCLALHGQPTQYLHCCLHLTYTGSSKKCWMSCRLFAVISDFASNK